MDAWLRDMQSIVEQVVRRKLASTLAGHIARDYPVVCYYFGEAIDRMQSAYWGGVPTALKQGAIDVIGDFTYYYIDALEASVNGARLEEALRTFVEQRRKALAIVPERFGDLGDAPFCSSAWWSAVERGRPARSGVATCEHDAASQARPGNTMIEMCCHDGYADDKVVSCGVAQAATSFLRGDMRAARQHVIVSTSTLFARAWENGGDAVALGQFVATVLADPSTDSATRLIDELMRRAGETVPKDLANAACGHELPATTAAGAYCAALDSYRFWADKQVTIALPDGTLLETRRLNVLPELTMSVHRAFSDHWAAVGKTSCSYGGSFDEDAVVLHVTVDAVRFEVLANADGRICDFRKLGWVPHALGLRGYLSRWVDELRAMGISADLTIASLRDDVPRLLASVNTAAQQVRARMSFWNDDKPSFTLLIQLLGVARDALEPIARQRAERVLAEVSMELPERLNAQVDALAAELRAERSQWTDDVLRLIPDERVRAIVAEELARNLEGISLADVVHAVTAQVWRRYVRALVEGLPKDLARARAGIISHAGTLLATGECSSLLEDVDDPPAWIRAERKWPPAQRDRFMAWAVAYYDQVVRLRVESEACKWVLGMASDGSLLAADVFKSVTPLLKALKLIDGLRNDETLRRMAQLVHKGDFRALAMTVIDVALSNHAPKYLSEPERRFFRSFASYVLDGLEGNVSELTREAFRSATTDLLLAAPGEGFPVKVDDQRQAARRRGIGRWPSIGLRWSWNPDYRNIEGKPGFRRIPTVQWLGGMWALSKNSGLHLSFIDIGSWTEVVLRDQAEDVEYEDSYWIALDALRPRLDFYLGLPEVTRNLALVVGVSARLVGLEACEGSDSDAETTCLRYQPIWEYTSHTPELSIGLMYRP